MAEKPKEPDYPIGFVDALRYASALNWSPEKDKEIYEIFGLIDPIDD